MSLSTFKAKNHPQQQSDPQQTHFLEAQSPVDDEVDDRALPPAEFSVLDRRFRFTVDVAASRKNYKCGKFYTKEDDGLSQSWAGERVYCNPPYSNIRPWIEKARLESQAQIIVMLLPANRTEQSWWQKLVEPYRDNGGALRVEFLPNRIRFIKKGRAEVGPNERPPFGCCLLVWNYQ